MFMVIDYDTQEELYVASYELQTKWNERRAGIQFFELKVGVAMRRVCVKERK